MQASNFVLPIFLALSCFPSFLQCAAAAMPEQVQQDGDGSRKFSFKGDGVAVSFSPELIALSELLQNATHDAAAVILFSSEQFVSFQSFSLQVIHGFLQRIYDGSISSFLQDKDQEFLIRVINLANFISCQALLEAATDTFSSLLVSQKEKAAKYLQDYLRAPKFSQDLEKIITRKFLAKNVQASIFMELFPCGSSVQQRPLSVSWSPDSSMLAVGDCSGTVQLFNSASQKRSSLKTGHLDRINSLSWLPATVSNPSLLVSCSNDQTLRISNPSSGNCVKIFSRQEAGIIGCSASPDGRKIASCSSNHRVRIADVSTERFFEMVGVHADKISCISWNSDSSHFASSSWDKTVRIWDASSGALLKEFKHDSPVATACFSPDGKKIASGTIMGGLYLWDISTEEPARLQGHRAAITSISWNPVGKEFVSASADQTVCLWDASAGKRLRVINEHQGAVNAVSWSSDGAEIASVSEDCAMRRFHLNAMGYGKGYTFKQLLALFEKSSSALSAAQFSFWGYLLQPTPLAIASFYIAYKLATRFFR